MAGKSLRVTAMGIDQKRFYPDAGCIVQEYGRTRWNPLRGLGYCLDFPRQDDRVVQPWAI